MCVCIHFIGSRGTFTTRAPPYMRQVLMQNYYYCYGRSCIICMGEWSLLEALLFYHHHQQQHQYAVNSNIESLLRLILRQDGKKKMERAEKLFFLVINAKLLACISTLSFFHSLCTAGQWCCCWRRRSNVDLITFQREWEGTVPSHRLLILIRPSGMSINSLLTLEDTMPHQVT